MAQSSAIAVRPQLSATERLQRFFFRPEDHPYRIYQAEVRKHVRPESVVVDAGCGYTAEVLQQLAPHVKRVIGLDLVDFDPEVRDRKVIVLKNDLAALALQNSSVDLAISRSVFEHLSDPLAVYREIARILKPGGRLVFLTPNSWDYASVCAKMIPNRLHPAIVKRVEGREERDTFPVFYRANTASAIRKLAAKTCLKVERIRYLGQYPCYLMFHPAAFLAGTLYEKVISGVPLFGPLRGWILATLAKPPGTSVRS